MGNMGCCPSVHQPVISLTIIVFGVTRNILVAIVAIVIIVCFCTGSVVGIKGYQLPVQRALLGGIISILRVVLGSLVGRGSIVFVLALAILRLVIVLLTFVRVVAISIAKAALVLANVAALVCVMAVLAAMLALAFAALLGFCLGRGIGHTTSKGRIRVLSFRRKCDLFSLARLLQLVLLAYDADELLAIDAPLRVYVRLVIILVLAHVWARKLIPGSRERRRDLLFEEVIIVYLLQLAGERDLFPLVLELGQMFRNVNTFRYLDST